MQKSRKNAHLNFTIGTNEFCDYTFVDKHEIIYVELLFAAYKNDRSRVFHRVHSQIGAYLSENQEKLDIKKTRRLMTRNPFGRENEVQEWRKKE